ncbi:MAG: hypothetical protein AB8E82_12420 [Aureispira sp.]
MSFVKNIQEAINVVQPFGVDLCSSVRKNGQLDEGQLKTFFQTLSKIKV